MIYPPREQACVDAVKAVAPLLESKGGGVGGREYGRELRAIIRDIESRLAKWQKDLI